MIHAPRMERSIKLPAGIHYERILLIATAALILALPDTQLHTYFFSQQPYIGDIFPFVKISTPVSQDQELNLPSSALPSGAYIPSKLIGMELHPMPIEVCLQNSTSIPEDIKKLFAPKDLESPEIGALAVSITYPESSASSTVIYARMGKKDCITLDPKNGKAILSKQITLRSLFIPRSDGIAVPIINFNNSNVTVQTKFNWVQYLKNVAICLFGIAILLELGGAVLRFVKK